MTISDTALEDKDNISDNTKEHTPDLKSEDPVVGQQERNSTSTDDPSSGRTPFSHGNKNMNSGIGQSFAMGRRMSPVPNDEQPGAETTIRNPGDSESCNSNSDNSPLHSDLRKIIPIKHLELKPNYNSYHPRSAFTGTHIFNLSNKNHGRPEDKQTSDENEMKCTNTPRDEESCSFNSNDLVYSDVMQMDPLDGQYPDLDAESQNILPEHTPCETEYQQHKTSFGMSVFNLANAIMGSGILGLSYAMANAGIIQFVILLILAASFSLYSVHLLLKTANEGGALVYEALGYKAFGMPGKLTTSCSITMQNIGAMSSFLYIIKYEFPVIIESFTGASDGEWYINGNYLVLLVSLFVILPLSLLRNLGYLAYSSGLSVLCMVFFLIVVIIKKFQMPCPLPTPDAVNETMHILNIDNVTSDDDDTCKPKYFVYNSQTVYAIPILTCAFACHPTILPMYEELKDRSRKKMQNVANVSFMAMFSIYLLAALFGYLTFYIHVEPELLHTYSQFYKYDVLLLVVRLAVLAAVTLTVPVVLFPIRTSVNHLLCPTKDFSWIRHIIITMVLLVGTNTLVIFVPTIRDIFGFIGASVAPVLIFILPSAFYIKLVKKESMRSMQKIGATMFLIIGFAVIFVSMSLIIHDWSTEGR
ncbi:hypothetical protein CHARACLAT_020601 [Characodon lateralis]|uniref:Sodium-coupled neutral amino acid symporter 2 n=1 Tax=Characodon lateralis TaxID=208331 RepID=A0ABU7D8H9_9TELE|nr:hypothetical protein [Characodon lateralis]